MVSPFVGGVKCRSPDSKGLYDGCGNGSGILRKGGATDEGVAAAVGGGDPWRGEGLVSADDEGGGGNGRLSQRPAGDVELGGRRKGKRSPPSPSEG